MLAGFLGMLRQLAQRFALRRRQRRLQRPAPDRFPGRLLAQQLGLRGGVFGIQLHQPRFQDVGLLLRVDHGQLPLEGRQSQTGALHLDLQLIQLPLHEGGQAGRAAHADVVAVFQIRLRDGIGRVRRQLRIVGAVADQHQIGVGRARHPQTS